MAEGEIAVTVTKKKWYKSTTLWFNVLAFIVKIVAKKQGFDIPPDVFVNTILGGNAALRFKTRSPLTK